MAEGITLTDTSYGLVPGNVVAELIVGMKDDVTNYHFQIEKFNSLIASHEAKIAELEQFAVWVTEATS